MTQTIEERTAERERLLQEQLSGQRRLARPEDYVFDKAQEQFWDLKDGTLHTEKSVDASIPIEFWRVEVTEPPEPEPNAPPRRGRPAQRRERLIPPSKDIQRVENDQFVENSTWWPGQPQVIRDWFVDANGFRHAPGRRAYNQYQAPPASDGDATACAPWLEHIRRLWPDAREHEYFFDYCAHMLQKPEEKCNAAIVLSGAQGIGKDAAMFPVRQAVGSWNVKNIDPDEIFSPYKPWLQTLMLVVNEVRPTKDEFHASSMYNILKPMIAAPPDTLPLNDKYQKLRFVINVMRVFITTNDWMAMYIPPEDRRMFIMHSALEKEWNLVAGLPDYFVDLFAWMETGGAANVAAWLMKRDLSGFNPKGVVYKTAGWEAVAGTWEEAEDGIAFAIDALGKPDVLFGSELLNPQFDYQEDVAGMLKSPRKIGHRMQKAGYLLVKNPQGDGRWTFAEGGYTYRSRLVFARQATNADPGKMIAAVRERGRELCVRLKAAKG